MTAEHQEFPKWMSHPMYQPASMRQVETRDAGGKVVVDTVGTAVRFPPVMVNDADQQGMHEAQGYEVKGKSDPDNFKRLAAAMSSAPAGSGPYKAAEFPKWVNGVLCHDESEEADAEVVVDNVHGPKTDEARADVGRSEIDELKGIVQAQDAQIKQLLAALQAPHPPGDLATASQVAQGRQEASDTDVEDKTPAAAPGRPRRTA